MLAERLDETKYLYGASVIIGMFPVGPLAVLTLRSMNSRGYHDLDGSGTPRLIRLEGLRGMSIGDANTVCPFGLMVTDHRDQNADSDLMLARRIRRDVRERGRDVEGILDQVSPQSPSISSLRLLPVPFSIYDL